MGKLTKLSYSFETQGLENIPQNGPFIICSNHASYFDPIWLLVYWLMCKVINSNMVNGIFVKYIITGRAHTTEEENLFALMDKITVYCFPAAGARL